MRSAGARALELAAIAAILALAGLQVWQDLGDPWREFDVVAAACAGLMGIAAGEIAAGARSRGRARRRSRRRRCSRRRWTACSSAFAAISKRT